MRSLRPWLQLVRLPAVFTAMADVFLGFLLTHSGIVELGPSGTIAFLLLLTASSGLYLAGMVFNDVFDWKTDLKERPERPIPSGRIALRSAVVFGGFLVLMGIGAAQASGWPSLSVALLLTLAIFAYDAYLK
ncbi:MAG: UbiA family prenyltransferase, partial [Planctomycetaceae bacterium]